MSFYGVTRPQTWVMGKVNTFIHASYGTQLAILLFVHHCIIMCLCYYCSWHCSISCTLKLYINKILILPEHVTAAIIHGQGPYAYIDVHSWPHDSNLTINILLDVLTKQNFVLPALYIQLDNTARENKDQYILWFLSYLVQMKIFSEVNFPVCCAFWQ